MKCSLAILVAAMSALAVTKSADAQCACAPTVQYYAPVATTAYYAAPATACCAPTVAYAAPAAGCCQTTTAWYAPTTAYYAPTTAYYGGYYGRGGLFGTGLFGWAGLRGFERRWDRRLGPEVTPY